MGYAHIILIFDDGLVPFLEERKNARHLAFAEIGEKIVQLCEAHANPFKPFPSDEEIRECGIGRTAPLDSHGNAIAWCGFPGSARDEVLYWGSCLKSIGQLDDGQLEWVRKAVEKEVSRRKRKP